MTTRRGLDPQETSGVDRHASDDGAVRVPLSVGANPVRDARLTSVPTSPVEQATVAGEDGGRENGSANASNPIPGDRRTGRDRSELDRVREIGHLADGVEQPVEPNQTVAESSPNGKGDDRVETAERSGIDTRRRGWFWHWNNVVTQYAPLIGLKGVGLLNSYTVWTDRRDESPHRGYAFPSQQSEADFYGEERAELITINKILVALDLIEIRKEMLTRVDERGRRWRVPHNLYRVKDRPDGLDLRANDVIRVAELAKRDATVFRYVRRVFSDRFRPIDGDNVWHTILSDLRNDPTWQELQERTRAIEARASARTRAGHQSRANTAAGNPRTMPDPMSPEAEQTDDPLLPSTQQNVTDDEPAPTSVGEFNTGSQSSTSAVVEPTNTGSKSAVDAANTGSEPLQPTSVAVTSNGRKRVVGPSNTTYDQADLTTTTTTTGMADDEPHGIASITAELTRHASRSVLTTATPLVRSHRGDRTVDRAASVGEEEVEQTNRDGRGGSARRRVANHSTHSDSVNGMEIETGEGGDDDGGGDVGAGSTPLEQRLDAQVEGGERGQRSTATRLGGSSRERRLADPDAGGPLVDPGPLVVSTFEAANDRRATPLERHLLAELARDADPAARAAGTTGAEWVVAAMREAVASGSAFVAPKRIREIITRWSNDTRLAPSPAPSMMTARTDDGSPASTPEPVAVEVRLPGGASGSTIWAAVLDDLARALDRDAFQRMLAGSRITRYWRGTVEVGVGSVAAADKLSNEYRGLVERHLNSRLRRPVAVCFEASPVPVTDTLPDHGPSEPEAPDGSRPLALSVAEVEVGRQVWQSLLTDLSRVVSPADLDRLAGVVVLGQDASGAILLGAPSPLARRLIDGRYRAAVETSLAALLGQPSPINVLDPAGWTIASRQ